MPVDKAPKGKQATGPSRNESLRRVVANAYAAIKGDEQNKTFQALTLEECIDQSIELIEGIRLDGRPNKMQQIDEIESTLLSAVAQIKLLPADSFTKVDPKTTVNPPVDYSEYPDDP